MVHLSSTSLSQILGLHHQQQDHEQQTLPQGQSKKSITSSRPSALNLSSQPLNRNSKSSSSTSSTPSLPVTPTTPFPPSPLNSDPFSQIGTLPEQIHTLPTSLSRTSSLSHQKRSGRSVPKLSRKESQPEIVVASPSTNAVHYLFPTLPSLTGNHLSPTSPNKGSKLGVQSVGLGTDVSRNHSLRTNRRIIAGEKLDDKPKDRKLSHPSDAFSASRPDKPRISDMVRSERLASEPMLRSGSAGVGRDSVALYKAKEIGSMRTLKRQPSMMGLGQKSESKPHNFEKRGPLLDQARTSTTSKRNDSVPTSTPMSFSYADPVPLGAPIDKSAISPPLPYTSHNVRRRSMSLGKPRAAPSIPSERASQVPVPPPPPPPPPPVNPRNDFVGFADPFPTHITKAPMTRTGFCHPIDFSKMPSQPTPKEYNYDSPTYTHGPVPDVQPSSGVPCTKENFRRSLSLKGSQESKLNRRRSQSVAAKPSGKWQDSMPPLPSGAEMSRSLGLGDPSVDMGDRYGTPRKASAMTSSPSTSLLPSRSHSLALSLTPSSPSSTERVPLGIEVNVQLGKVYPFKHASYSRESKLSTSTATSDIVSITSSSDHGEKRKGLGLGLSPLDSPISLPDSLVDEAVDLTGIGKGMMEIDVDKMYKERRRASSSASKTSIGKGSLRTEEGSKESTPYLSSSGTTPNTSNYNTPLLTTPLTLETTTIPDQPIPSQEDTKTKYEVGSGRPDFTRKSSLISRSLSYQQVAEAENEHQEDLSKKASLSKRLSRSFSVKSKTRSPIPPELRIDPPEESTSPRAINPLVRSWSIRKKQSEGELSTTLKWRPPSIYSICLPEGAIEPLPSANEFNQAIETLRPSTNTTSLPPHSISVSSLAPIAQGARPPSTGQSKSKSKGFMTASSSFRGIAKGLSKSISRTFDRSYFEYEPAVDSGLKAKISAPIEASRGQNEEDRDKRISRSLGRAYNPDSAYDPESIGRNSNYSQLSVQLPYQPASVRHEDSTQENKSRSSMRSSFSLNIGSMMSAGANSYPRRSRFGLRDSRTLLQIGKQESNLSAYSTNSTFIEPKELSSIQSEVKPKAQPAVESQNLMPTSHWSPSPKRRSKFKILAKLNRSKSPPPPTPLPDVPEPLPTTLFTTVEIEPEETNRLSRLAELGSFPKGGVYEKQESLISDSPNSTRTVPLPNQHADVETGGSSFRSPDRSKSRSSVASKRSGFVTYTPQPLIEHLSSTSPTGKSGEDKTKKVLEWREEVEDKGDLVGLDDMIQEHVKKEKEVLKRISGRASGETARKYREAS